MHVKTERQVFQFSFVRVRVYFKGAQARISFVERTRTYFNIIIGAINLSISGINHGTI